jgi:hypothetical protein
MKCVVELGCFDGRALDYLPPPIRYHGYDAGWEGGLNIARERFIDHSECIFHECKSPGEFANDTEKASLFVSLETIEHIPLDMLEGYLLKLAKVSVGYFNRL